MLQRYPGRLNFQTPCVHALASSYSGSRSYHFWAARQRLSAGQCRAGPINLQDMDVRAMRGHMLVKAAYGCHTQQDWP
jgi:hypothetical protein